MKKALAAAILVARIGWSAVDFDRDVHPILAARCFAETPLPPFGVVACCCRAVTAAAAWLETSFSFAFSVSTCECISFIADVIS